jgi:hypothetical protein
MTLPARFGTALQGAAKGIVPGIVAAVLLLLVILARSCRLELPLYEIYVLPTVVLMGGCYGAMLGLAIGWASYKRASTEAHRVWLWIICGALTSIGVSEIPSLLDLIVDGGSAEDVLQWSTIAFFGVCGAVLGPIIGARAIRR